MRDISISDTSTLTQAGTLYKFAILGSEGNTLLGAPLSRGSAIESRLEDKISKHRSAISEFVGIRYLRVIAIYLQLKRLQGLQSVQSCPKPNTNRTCVAYRIQGIINIHATPAGVEIAMESSTGRTKLQPPTLPDPRRCPGRFKLPGRMDPVVTKATCNGSDPTKTAAGNVTTGAQREVASRLGKASSLGSDSMMVTRRNNTVLEEMQANWAKEQMESLRQIPGEYPKKVFQLSKWWEK